MLQVYVGQVPSVSWKRQEACRVSQPVGEHYIAAVACLLHSHWHVAPGMMGPQLAPRPCTCWAAAHAGACQALATVGSTCSWMAGSRQQQLAGSAAQWLLHYAGSSRARRGWLCGDSVLRCSCRQPSSTAGRHRLWLVAPRGTVILPLGSDLCAQDSVCITKHGQGLQLPLGLCITYMRKKSRELLPPISIHGRDAQP